MAQQYKVSKLVKDSSERRHIVPVLNFSKAKTLNLTGKHFPDQQNKANIF